MDVVLFDGWDSLMRTAVLGVLSYAVLVLLLRVSGKRTLSKMNAFDFIVTIALGSALATVLLGKDTSLAQGACAFAVLIGLQFIVTWLSVRVPGVQAWVTGEPRLLLYDGAFIESALREERVTRDEVLAAIRGAGHASANDVRAVVLQTDASFAVVSASGSADESALVCVRGARPTPSAATEETTRHG